MVPEGKICTLSAVGGENGEEISIYSLQKQSSNVNFPHKYIRSVGPKQ